MTVARGRATPPDTPQAQPQVGCQLIVFGQRGEEDLRGVLADVRAAGFDGIEAHVLQAGNAAAVRTALAEFGLVQWSLSLGYHQCVDGGDWMIDYAQGVGSKFIMVSGAGDHEAEGLRAYEGGCGPLQPPGNTLSRRRDFLLLPQPLLGISGVRRRDRAGAAVCAHRSGGGQGLH